MSPEQMAARTVPVTTGAALGLQLLVRRDPPDPLRLVPARTSPKQGFLNKPDGGLWTSTFRDGASDWVRWCGGEDFGAVDVAPWWLLTPRADARLIEIDDMRDLARVMDAYGIGGRLPWVPDHRTLDFDAMVRDGFDGLHLTAHGATACHFGDWSSGLSLNAWDCESTVWFHWAFDTVREVIR